VDATDTYDGDRFFTEVEVEKVVKKEMKKENKAATGSSSSSIDADSSSSSGSGAGGSSSDAPTTTHEMVRKATPLLLVLVCIELSDLVFAVSSGGGGELVLVCIELSDLVFAVSSGGVGVVVLGFVINLYCSHRHHTITNIITRCCESITKLNSTTNPSIYPHHTKLNSQQQRWTRCLRCLV